MDKIIRNSESVLIGTSGAIQQGVPTSFISFLLSPPSIRVPATPKSANCVVVLIRTKTTFSTQGEDNSHLNVAIHGDQNIIGLDIAVHVVIGVQIRQALQCLQPSQTRNCGNRPPTTTVKQG